MDLARKLEAPVTFHEPALGQEVMEHYRAADTCVVSLRDDWKSFETTVPSKTYEVLAVGRHVTGIVLGEARDIIEASKAGTVVPSNAKTVAQMWRQLQEDRSLLLTGTSGRDWVEANVNISALSAEYGRLITRVCEKRFLK